MTNLLVVYDLVVVVVAVAILTVRSFVAAVRPLKIMLYFIVVVMYSVLGGVGNAKGSCC